MGKQLTLASLFDGSGGFPLGGMLAGIQPVWASEIEPFPIRVTTKRMPFMKHYGDVSKIDGAKVEPVDIITFGSPCQDMSVAGKRVGLDGNRSGLFHQAIRIIKEMRKATNGRYPTFIVWENVPGAFSSNRGEDFRCVLEEVCSITTEGLSIPQPDKWLSAGEIVGDTFSVAWRQLDAQYWGVPQRRKRIYLVGDLAGQRASKILFESEGLSRYSAESFNSWKETTEDIRRCPDKTGESRVYENQANDSRIRELGRVGETVNTRYGTGGNNQPLVMRLRCGCEGGGKGALIQENKTGSIACHNDQTLFEPIGFDAYNQAPTGNVSKSLTTKTDTDHVPVALESCNWDGTQTAPTLSAHNANGSQRMPDKEHFNRVISTSHTTFHLNASENLANTLASTDYKAPPSWRLINLPPYGQVTR